MHQTLLMKWQMLVMEKADVVFQLRTYFQRLFSFLDIHILCPHGQLKQNSLLKIAFNLVACCVKLNQLQLDFHVQDILHRFSFICCYQFAAILSCCEVHYLSISHI